MGAPPGHSLRQRRKARGWSQQILSKRIQSILCEEGHAKTVSAAAIGKYERGEANPGDAVRNAINSIFNTTLWNGEREALDADSSVRNPFVFSILKPSVHLIYRPSYDEQNIICAALEFNEARNRFTCTHKSGSGSLQCVSGAIDVHGQHLFLTGNRTDTGIKEFYSFQIMLPHVVQKFLVGLCITSTYDGNIYSSKVYGEPSQDKTRDELMNISIGTWPINCEYEVERAITHLFGNSGGPVLKYE